MGLQNIYWSEEKKLKSTLGLKHSLIYPMEDSYQSTSSHALLFICCFNTFMYACNVCPTVKSMQIAMQPK